MVTKTSYQFPFLKDDVNLYTLENSHRVVLIKKPGEITNISTWVKTGSINEDDSITGISHFLEHLMFKGTERLGPGEFDKLLESRGGLINAATWKDYTFYYVTIPKGENNENFNLALDLHADMMVNSNFPDREIGPAYKPDEEVKEKRERSVVIEEISMRDDQPWNRIYNELNSMMYQNHPYKRDTIGTKEVVASVPRETIVEYYNKWYVPENFITIVVSDFPDEDVLAMIKKHFIFKDPKPSPKSNYTLETPTQETKIKNITGEITTAFGIVGYLGPKPTSLKDSISLDIISLILGEGRSSRLNQNLIEKPENPIFNAAGCCQYSFRDGNNFMIQCNFKADKKDQAIQELTKEVNGLIDCPITDEELKKAKKKLESRFAEVTETASSLAESVGYAIILTNNFDTITKYLSTLESIDKEYLKYCVNEYLNINNACISTMTPVK